MTGRSSATEERAGEPRSRPVEHQQRTPPEDLQRPGTEKKFGDPKLGRTPDIIVQPTPGTIYSASAKKIAEHGGFSDDDTHVLLLVSNPLLEAKKVGDPVVNQQVAPTILRALGLNPRELQAVRLEHTRVLPEIEFED